MTAKRIFWWSAIALGLLLVAAVTVTTVLQSQWFYNRVRTYLVDAVETATGGRVEIGSLRFHWKRLRAEVSDFVLHGTEPAGKPPLLRVSSAAVGLKIISVLKRDVDIQYLEVDRPQVYLIIYPDGRTNVPEPKIKKQGKNAVETILDLAIGRFNIQNGLFEVESRTKIPFSARGERLAAHFDYEMAGPRYRGNLSVQPLNINWPDLAPTPFGVDMAVVVERNRIEVGAAKLTTGRSQVEFSGTLDDLEHPRAVVRYSANVAVDDAARILKLKQLRGGSLETSGEARWPGGNQISASGRFRAEHVDYRDTSVQLRNLRADGALNFTSEGLHLTGIHFGGDYVSGATRIPANGQIARAEIHPAELDVRGIDLMAVGGEFRGDGRLRNLDRFSVTGELRNFNARRTVALYSHAALPWDATASGTVQLEGSLRRSRELRASAALTIEPVAGSAPVMGHITAAYDAASGLVELGNSSLSLPHTRAEFSGTLGRQVRFHFETSDLNDILPALGDDAAALPVKVENGRVVFDGTVDGTFEHPVISGALNAANVSYLGNLVPSLQAQVTASPENVRLQNAAVTRGALRAQFEFAVALQDWKTSDASQIFGNGSMRNAAVTEVAALAGQKDLEATGTLSALASVSGTIGQPLIHGDLEVTKGAYRTEPFDHIVVHLDSAGNTIRVTNGQLDAGAKQVKFSATYQHAPGRFDTGVVKAQLASNSIALDEVASLKASRPDIRGAAQVNASAELEIKPSAAGKNVDVRPIAIQADVTARGLQLTGQTLGNAHLTAQSQGPILHARLESDFAGSSVHGEGQWRLEGDYPGEATVTFSRLDFAQLRAWISPASNATVSPSTFAGSAEGELRISGPALKPEALQADLRLPVLELGPLSGPPPASQFTFRNQGPILIHVANSVLTIESARLTGPDTDISLTGRANLREKNPLDIRANGRIGLDILRNFEPDIRAEGSLALDATVRGELSSPQISGRLELQKAAVNLVDIPNGISNATGTILFNGDRATIQSLSGETGGGTVNLSGFFAYGGSTQTFRVHADAKQVRVRYPEGVSTVANASLTLQGSVDRSSLSGTITVLRTGFNPQSDFSSILASGAAPLETPSVKPGLLSGMKFDVAIETDPEIQFQSSLTQDLQVDANLHLRGTAANPSLSGRINITQGQLVFYGTKFTINQGSIAFFNPVKIEPILDIDLETRANGVDITLTVSGPINKLRLTPRSDPPMQFSEIVQLLATGNVPTTDPAILSQQTVKAQSWQQLGASALLGQAIASPVGRLQRLFGVSKLRIDPTIGGLENNPQARLTLEQQVSSDITFTYITNVTSGNPQVVRVEWAFSKRWSVVALREENGVTGVDFFFKKRF